MSLFLLTPFILLADLLLLAGSEVVLDVERLADLLGSFSLDHVGHCLAGDVQETLGEERDWIQYCWLSLRFTLMSK